MTRLFKRLCITYLFISLLVPTLNYASSADSVLIPPIKDNTLYETTDGSLSNGAGSYFFTGKTGTIDENQRRRGLISFDIAGNIPAGADIQSVTLKLNMSRTPFNTNRTTSLHKLTADWGEGASNAPGQEGVGTSSATNDATWLHRFFNTSLWSSQGGDFEPSSSASIPVGGIGNYTFGSTASMVADVQDWLDNPANNFGWIIIGNEAVGSTAKRFDSKENGIPLNRPVLTVTYTPPICCVGLRGDVNGDGDNATVLDLSYLVDEIYRGGPVSPCPEEADINNDGESSSVIDLTFLIDLIYRGGSAPDSCP